MSAFAVPLMVIGTTMMAVSQIQQAKAASDAAKYNAELARQQAGAERVRGKQEEKKLKRQKRLMLSKQRAAYAAAGVRIGTGSPLEVMADTAAQYELDIAASRYNTQIGISRALSEAEYQEKAASQYRKMGYFSAAGTLLTGYGRAANIGYGGQTKKE
jgi:hypothetical protein